MKHYFSILLQSPLLRGIDPLHIPLLLKNLQASTQTFAKGDFLFQEGIDPPQIAIVLDGLVQIQQLDYMGNRTIITEIGASEMLGEVFACAHICPIPVSAQALETTTIVLFSFENLIHPATLNSPFHSQLVANMMTILAEKSVVLNTKIRHLACRTTKEKILSFLSSQASKAKNPSFSIPFSRQEMADYLCVDRSALSAELSRMQKQGILTYNKNQFTLLHTVL